MGIFGRELFKNETLKVVVDDVNDSLWLLTIHLNQPNRKSASIELSS
jgi:hypothetical protein